MLTTLDTFAARVAACVARRAARGFRTYPWLSGAVIGQGFIAAGMTDITASKHRLWRPGALPS